MAKKPDTGPSGLVVIDKDTDWTSHDVVAKLRGILRTRKVGHSGTLDPDATGVLVIGVGRATRLLRFLTELPKSYTGEIVLGTETSTLDAAGDVTAEHDMSAVTASDVDAAVVPFRGDILQVPPMVSAIKVDGKRLHALAREGIEIERDARPVTIHSLEVAPTDDPLIYHVDVSCSSGTYIRSLAADIGTALGGGAHLRALRRTSVGGFSLAESHKLDDVDEASLLPISDVFRGRPRCTVDAEVAALIANGRVLDVGQLGVDGDGPWAVLDETGLLLAVYERRGETSVKPAVVIPPAPPTAEVPGGVENGAAQ